ncbi:putative LTR transposable element, partial [Pseudoloma neurophilia]
LIVKEDYIETERATVTEEKFVKDLHIYLGHPGSRAFYLTIRQLMNKKWLRSLCNKICAECQICAKIKHRKENIWIADLNLIEKNVLQKFSVDICGPFTLEPEGDVQKRVYIITMTDLHSRFVKIGVLNNLSAIETVRKLKKMFTIMGVPMQLISDNGVQFRSAIFRDLMKTMGIAHTFSRIYNPRANSKSERINKTINELMRIFIIGYNTEQVEKCLENRLNLVYNRSIGCTPHELHFKKNGLDDSIEVSPQITDKANEISYNQALYDKNVKNYKKRRFDIKIGDLIFMKTPRGSKQSILWDGPFLVLKTNSKSNGIKIQLKKNRNQWINARNCFSWKGAECRNQNLIKTDQNNQIKYVTELNQNNRYD